MDEPLSHAMRWQAFGVCASTYVRTRAYAALDTVFFGDIGRPRINKLSDQYCLECPVKQLCLEDALVHDEQYGVWGGLNTDQRKDFAAINEDLIKSLIRRAIEENWLQENRIQTKRVLGWVWKIQREIHLEREAAKAALSPPVPVQLLPDYESFPQFALHMEAS